MTHFDSVEQYLKEALQELNVSEACPGHQHSRLISSIDVWKLFWIDGAGDKHSIMINVLYQCLVCLLPYCPFPLCHLDGRGKTQ